MKGILHLPKDLIQKLAIEYIDDVESFAQSHPYFRRCIDMDNIHRKKELYNYPNDRIRIFATKLALFPITDNITFLHADFKNHYILFYQGKSLHGVVMEINNENAITGRLFKSYPVKRTFKISILYNITSDELFEFIYKILNCGYSCQYEIYKDGESRKYFFN